MANRIYDIELECGCMISADGGGGVIPCYADYGDMKNKKDRERLKLCKKSWEKWHNSKEYKEHMKEVAKRNP